MPTHVSTNAPESTESAPLGEPIAPSAERVGPPPSSLPPGAHPQDPSADPTTYTHEQATPPDLPGDRFNRGDKPWPHRNENALPVFQRAASDWSTGVVFANANTNGGTAIVVGRQKGRKSITLWVPITYSDGTAAKGCVIGPDESELQRPSGRETVLNPGDSITIESEASVYIGCIGANATGDVQYECDYNIVGGSSGSGD